MRELLMCGALALAAAGSATGEQGRYDTYQYVVILSPRAAAER